MKRYMNLAVILSLLLLVLYEHGLRIADMSEVPNSKRPIHLIVRAGI